MANHAWEGPLEDAHLDLPSKHNYDALYYPDTTPPLPKPYRRIDASRFIRLVVIEPGNWESPISCRLVHSFLDRDPTNDYVALSYAWGSPRVTRPVLVDGTELQVTVNLESALRHLRREWEPLTLWIDAISINQQDLDERSEQVSLMRSIYQHASRVIVWLGDGVRHRIVGLSRHSKPPARVTFYGDDRDDERVAEFSKQWSIPKPSAKYTAIDVLCFVRTLLLQDCADYSVARLHPSHLLGITEALRIMLLSQWWTRMWVFQEVIVASSVVLQYSGVEAPLEMFTEAASCLQDPRYAMNLPSDAATVLHYYSKTLSDVAHWRGLWREKQSQGHLGGASELLGLLRATGMRKASGDRDRVFALLGLVDLQKQVIPDYQQSPASVFMSNRSDLPSWTADWSAMVHDSDEVRISLLEKYKACGDRKAKAILSPLSLRDWIVHCLETSDYQLWLPPWAKAVFNLLALWKPHRPEPRYETLKSTGIYMLLVKADSSQTALQSDSPAQQVVEIFYEHPIGGRLCGFSRRVGTVQTVNAPVYEPIGHDVIIQNIKWIADMQELPKKDEHLRTKYGLTPSSARSLVFDMKYVDGQYHGLQEGDLESLSRWTDHITQPPDATEDQTSHPEVDSDAGFDVVFKTLAARRKTFRANNGSIGSGPLDTQPGDGVFVLPGGRTPFFLRIAADQHGVEVLQLVGDCFLEGAMDGKWEIVEPQGHPEQQQFVLPPMFWSECKYDLVRYINKEGGGEQHGRINELFAEGDARGQAPATIRR
ncbi:heterokaryon incompatibility protein-domain-containing protein [Apiospora saccharicola]|uniref:Heterokaryon incompatibility protein-domain-containing protein n=1 Tax=Apiospora saccharicola TaxID=335842 RepID=A0ABR1UFW1_9PEZI